MQQWPDLAGDNSVNCTKMPEKDLYRTEQLFSADEMRWLRVLRESQWEKTQLMNPFSNDRFDILCESIYSSAYKL